MQRWGSMSSLASRDIDRKPSSKPAQGFLKLDILIDDQKRGKSIGRIYVTVKEARNLAITEPYVKLYLSKDGKDIKGTKQKTKPQKKTNEPLFEEEFEYDITKKTPLDANSRVQVTIWEHGRTSTCVGGMSFTFHDLMSNSGVSGWFKLLSEEDGRYQNQPATRQDMQAAAEELSNGGGNLGSSQAPSGSTISLSKMRSSIRKSVFKKKDKKKDAKQDDPPSSDTVRAKYGASPPADPEPLSTPPQNDANDEDDDDAAGGGGGGGFNRFGARFGAKATKDEEEEEEETDSARKDQYMEVQGTDDDPEPEPEPAASRFGARRSSKAQAQEAEKEEETATTTLGSRFGARTAKAEEESEESGGLLGMGARFGQRATEDNKAEKEKERESTPPPAAAAPVVTLDEPEDYSTEMTLPTLKRADSLTSLSSLTSIASMNIISSSKTQGELLLTVRRDRGSGALQGRLSLSIKQGRNLGATQPYVKVYISKNGKDIKSTKKKTKPQRGAVFEEQLSIPLTPDMASSACRVQITVWDHGRVKTNEVRGGFSFSLTDITTQGMSGWFRLLPYREGRSSFEGPREEGFDDDDAISISSDVSEGGSDKKSKRRSMTGSIRKMKKAVGRKKQLPVPGLKRGSKKAASDAVAAQAAQDQEEKERVTKILQSSSEPLESTTDGEQFTVESFLPDSYSAAGDADEQPELEEYNPDDDADGGGGGGGALLGSLENLDAQAPPPTAPEAVEVVYDEPAVMVAAGSVTSLASSTGDGSAGTDFASRFTKYNKGIDSITSSTVDDDEPAPTIPPEESADLPAPAVLPVEPASDGMGDAGDASTGLPPAIVEPEPQPEPEAEPDLGSFGGGGGGSNLKRSDSLTSLTSIMSSNIVSAKDIQGSLKLDIRLVPGKTRKSIGTLFVTVKEGRSLNTKEPYVKLYISKDKKDIKNTKQKTKPIKGTDAPLYEHKFEFNLTTKMELSDKFRLQVTVWDNARLRNECMGGMSFSLQQLSQSEMQGWFRLFPYREGRTQYDLITTVEEELAASSFSRMVNRQAIDTGSRTSLDTNGSGHFKSAKLPASLAGSDLSLRGSQSSLRRADSLTSLTSIASVNIVSRKNVTGLLRLQIRFEPADDGDTTTGTVHLTVKEGRDLGTKEPYVKMYLSKDGKDVKSTKQKTKIQKNTESPLYEERLVFYLPKRTELNANNRLQITVWDHARLRSNECFGGMSFSFMDIASTTSIDGWFHLLPYHEGRSRFRKTTMDIPDVASKRNSTNSLKKGLSGLSQHQTASAEPTLGAFSEPGTSTEPPRAVEPVLASASTMYKAEKDTTRRTSKSDKEREPSSTRRRFIGGTSSKKSKEIEELQEQLQAALAREEQLQAEVQVLRPMCIENAQLRQDVDGNQENVTALEAEKERLTAELEELTTALKKSKQQAAVCKEDADARRQDLAAQRDKYQDLMDENRGLRGYIDNLLQELMKLDMRAVNRASTHLDIR